MGSGDYTINKSKGSLADNEYTSIMSKKTLLKYAKLYKEQGKLEELEQVKNSWRNTYKEEMPSIEDGTQEE